MTPQGLVHFAGQRRSSDNFQALFMTDNWATQTMKWSGRKGADNNDRIISQGTRKNDITMAEHRTLSLTLEPTATLKLTVGSHLVLGKGSWAF